MLFTGHFEHTIDAKQRLAIPSVIRGQWRSEEHGGAWYAVPWTDGVIRLFTETDFVTRAKRDYSVGLTPSQDESELLATFFGMARRLEMDSAGRIRLPEETLEDVGLASEVVLVGAGEWLEIRDRAEWRQSRKERLRRLPELLERIEARKRANGASLRPPGSREE